MKIYLSRPAVFSAAGKNADKLLDRFVKEMAKEKQISLTLLYGENQLKMLNTI